MSWKKRLLATMMTAVILATIMIGAVPGVEKACAQAAGSPAGTGKITQVSALDSQMMPVRQDLVNSISAAQWSLSGLQGYLGMLMSKRPLTDAERRQVNDAVSKANTDISQWNTKKADLSNKIASIEANTGFSAMSPNDASMAHGRITEIRALMGKMDIVMSQMKSTVDLINKNK